MADAEFPALNTEGATPAIVPDTSVIVDGRITQRIEDGELRDRELLIPEAVVAELEYQANEGRETGFNGLDEILAIQELKEEANIEVDFVGSRPDPGDIEFAKSGELDAQIRKIAVDYGATLVTSDRVQAHVSRAQDIPVEYLRPIWEPEDVEADLSSLRVVEWFEDDTMSVHLKFGVPPTAKKGTPGNLRLQRLREEPMDLDEMTQMRAEIIEAARRDHNSFVEIEREGATVVQLGSMRVAVSQPPFSDSIEITAVRPVTKLTLDEYDLSDELLDRLGDSQRGIFVSGPPGSGKSTFVTSVAEWMKDKETVVKTMESPRDLQVSDDVTQYAPLEGDMEFTSDVLLLVRPDYVVYDEVRKTRDFEIFADMRLAGVGLVGVTHANRAIDAIQRLLGRVELGMIPQVVDTVIHIEGGEVEHVLELSLTVKVPEGMTEDDLARPVVHVRDYPGGDPQYEIYTYGEQTVVMPVEGDGAGGGTAKDQLAENQLRYSMQRWIDGEFEVELAGSSSCTVYVQEWEIPKLIGKGGNRIQEIENEVGLDIDVQPLEDYGGARGGGHLGGDGHGGGGQHGPSHGGVSRHPEVRKTDRHMVLALDRDLAGENVDVLVDGNVLFTATVGGQGEVKVKRDSAEGQALVQAANRGQSIEVVS
jgi:ATPase